jgi:hypothetical protein
MNLERNLAENESGDVEMVILNDFDSHYTNPLEDYVNSSQNVPQMPIGYGTIPSQSQFRQREREREKEREIERVPLQNLLFYDSLEHDRVLFNTDEIFFKQPIQLQQIIIFQNNDCIHPNIVNLKR